MDKKYLSEHLIGNRICLKKHDMSLSQTMFDYVDEDRQRLGHFLTWVKDIKTAEDTKEYIESTHGRWDNYSYFDYGIFQKSDDLYIGNIGVHAIRWSHNSAELGYWILGKFEGQGYMSEAVMLIESHLFELGFHRVQIRCSDLNSRSAGVPIRCDYHFEGTAREDAIENGKYRNTKTFSKLSTDKPR